MRGTIAMIVAGIDPSLTSAGICVLVDGAPVLLRSVGWPGRDGASYADRGDRIVAQARHIVDTALCAAWHRLARNRPGLVVIEGPSYGSSHGHEFDRAGLWWGIYTALRARNIPTAVVAPRTRACWATGSGRATKADVLTAVRQWWPNARIPNHDVADAAALALMGAHRFGDPTPFDVKPRHAAGLDAVAWPDTLTTGATE